MSAASGFRGKPNTPRVGSNQAEALDRLKRAHAPMGSELNMLVSVGTADGTISPRYSVKMIEEPAHWVWVNADPVSVTGMVGIVDKAVFYHPAFDEPLMSMNLGERVLVTVADTVTFETGRIRLSGDTIAQFRWPPEDYLIEELEEPT